VLYVACFMVGGMSWFTFIVV